MVAPLAGAGSGSFTPGRAVAVPGLPGKRAVLRHAPLFLAQGDLANGGLSAAPAHPTPPSFIVSLPPP